ncbi:imm11 family protein [Avibacterium paragallinarum]|uniref:Immunity MXAN-0049 protein domain-containing protein n=1 Tax=Avibacterium paragallinarum TaxID=728 RepID=A0ABU7QT09_AVIPA|nr:DUF1629 domain-containing protein [Avibacterium paragallinarum]
MKVYELKRNFDESGGFVLRLPPEKALDKFSILSLSHIYKGKNLPDNIIEGEFKVFPSNQGKKNYKFDFHTEGNIFIISERIYEIVYPVLSTRGHFFNIKTDSKRKKYIGYHLTNVIDCLDLNNSIYKKYENGIRVYKPVLFQNKINGEYIFQIKEDISRVFVTDKFQKILEENNILDFHFGEHNIVSLTSNP